MRFRRASIFSLPLLVLCACPTEPPKPPPEPKPIEDEWSRLPTSKEWLVSLGDFSGDKPAECAHVLGDLKKESDCAGAMCEHGRDLASDWIARCEAKMPSDAASAKELLAKMKERATEKPDPCQEELDVILDGKCDEATCMHVAERWATKCAKKEGSPLAVKILERMLERKGTDTGAVTLDVRTCDELAIELRDAATCKDLFVCQDKVKFVEQIQSRCGDEKPTIAIAAMELSVLANAQAPAKPIEVRPDPAVRPGDVPVALADGSGVIAQVCDTRVSDLAKYLDARAACQGGKITMARAFKTPNGVEVRAGTLDFPSDDVFLERYPTLAAAGENEARDRAALKGFDAELTKITRLAATPANQQDAAKRLAWLFVASAVPFRRDNAFRASLAAHDEALAPTFAALGRMKSALAKTKMSAGDLLGFARRAEERPFADISKSGDVEAGAFTRASSLSIADAIPRAMATYRDALKPLALAAKSKKVDKRAVAAAEQRAKDQAGVCAANERRMQEAKGAIVSCAFGLATCGAGAEAETKQLDDARAAAEAAYREIDAIETGAGEARAGEIADYVARAGCREPWW